MKPALLVLAFVLNLGQAWAGCPRDYKLYGTETWCQTKAGEMLDETYSPSSSSDVFDCREGVAAFVSLPQVKRSAVSSDESTCGKDWKKLDVIEVDECVHVSCGLGT